MIRTFSAAALVVIVATLAVRGQPIQQRAPIQRGGQGQQFAQGQILRVDPANGSVVIRSATGAVTEESIFQVNDATKYWGTNRQPFNNGLRNEGFKPGTNVWYIPGTHR